MNENEQVALDETEANIETAENEIAAENELVSVNEETYETEPASDSEAIAIKVEIPTDGAIAVNNKSLVEENFVEFERELQKRRKSTRLFYTIAIAAIGVYIVLKIIFAVNGNDILNFDLAVALCMVIVIVSWIYIPRKFGKLRYNQYMVTKKANPNRKTCFYDDYYGIMVDGAMANKFNYSDIVKVSTTKAQTLYIFEFANKVYSFGRLDGFSYGSWEIVAERIESIQNDNQASL